MSSADFHKINDYESLLVALKNVLGVVIPDDQRSHFVESIEPLLSRYKLDSLASLAKKLQGEEMDVRTDVLDVISQRQSNWCLSSETKKILHDYVFSQLAETARIWIVGCDQGQLTYSIAMEIARFEHENGETKCFELLASERSSNDIEQAEQATYSTQQLLTLSDEYKKLFITMDSKNEHGQVKDSIRHAVTFSSCDLTNSMKVMEPVDLIICPEVLAYFSNTVKAGIVQKFSDSLNSGGIFLTGHDQIVPVDQGLERVIHPAGIFYRQKN